MATLRPGEQPFARLAEALIQETDWDQDDAADLEQHLRSGSLALNWRLGLSPLPADTRLLILVDQFEELFRYGAGTAPDTTPTAAPDTAAFIALLLGAATHPAVYVVITLRSEFLGDCSPYPDLPEAINRGLFLVSSLSQEQMADAIQLPAGLPQFGGEVDPGLVRRLLAEARGQGDQLPLLQHALMRLWDRAREAAPAGPPAPLLAADLDAIGGLAKCLDRHADEAFAECEPDPQRRHIAETLCRALTEVGAGGRVIRRPVTLGEVAALTGEDWPAVAAVAECFRQPGRSFLMPPAGTELKPGTLLDITHEALIRQWQKLRAWTLDEAEQAELYLRLESAAVRHRAGLSAFLVDPDLQIALKWREEQGPTKTWAGRYGGDFDLAMGFLEASREKRDRGAVHSEQQRLERTRELFDSRLTHAALLARVEDYAQARVVLHQTVALDPDVPEHRRHTRNLLAGFVDIMGASADKVYEGAGAQLSGGVAVSPDGCWLAAAGERATLVLFDAQTGELVRRLEGHDPKASSFGGVRSVVFDPDGRWLYSGGDDRRIIRWSGPAGTKLAEWEAPGQVCALALSPDGKVLTSGGTDDVVTLWSTETGKKLGTLKDHTGAIASPKGLAFSPDGKRLASASYDKTARIWGLETNKRLRTLKWHDCLQAIAYDPAGKLVATAGNDRRIVLWDADSGRQLRQLVGHTNIVFGLAFDSTGNRLLSASRDSTMRLWDVATGIGLRVYQGHSTGICAVAGHGQTLYTAANDQTASIIIPASGVRSQGFQP